MMSHTVRVADLRRQMGMLQGELADKIGVRYETLSRIESGQQVPSYGTARAIAIELGLLAAFEPVKGSHFDYFHSIRQTRAYTNYNLRAAKSYLLGAGIQCDTTNIFGKEVPHGEQATR